ncbi:hypothetical protein PR202_ga23622 [Eleusine coracana subsp. coracana]|uniref:KIB1-4 beta-propeller domain-containing protein n=1 Tax=Eleusine coracana subsp. coracana TaxID=191504 RepID=A0AAV5D6A1_ELECO|nr:hypothetical protein PR202_ga23622 [Eleusine coracana subsp. coracana]
MARSGDKMFMVRQPLELAKGETPRLAVFRADISSRQWVEVSTLGDGTGGGDYDGEVLLVGRQCSRAVDACGPGRDAVRRDQIFFFLPDDPGSGWPSAYLNHTAVYDMRDGTVTEVQRLDQWRTLRRRQRGSSP